MPARSKFQEVVDLYRDGLVKESIDSDAKVNAFLSYASKHYRFPYGQCVCAFTQKPEATAFATFDAWNNMFNRKIIKDRRSVGVFDSSLRNGMKYLYDISDTEGSAVMPKHWQLQEEHKEAVIKMLQSKYLGSVEGDYSNFDNALSRSIEQAVVGNEYQINDIEKNRIDIMLSIEECTTKVVNERLGLPDAIGSVQLHETYSYERIEDILTLTSEISKDILTDIEREVKHIEKQKLIERSIEDERQNSIHGREGRSGSSELESTGESHTDSGDREIRTPGEELSDAVLSTGSEETGQQIRTQSDNEESSRDSIRSKIETSGRPESEEPSSRDSNVSRENAVQSADGRSSGRDNSDGHSLSKTRIRRSKAQMNFARIEKLAPHIFDGRYDYQSMKAKGFMDLSIERLTWSSDKEIDISIAHYGKQNGDLMADPEITVTLDLEKKTVIPLTYYNAYLGKEDYVFNDDRTQWRPKLAKSITSHLDEWLRNIESQGHIIYKANYNDELYEAKKSNPSFNELGQEIGYEVDGKPEGELANKNIFTDKKEQISFLEGTGNDYNANEETVPLQDELTIEQWESMDECDSLEHAILAFENGFEIRTYAEDLIAPVLNSVDEITTAYEKTGFLATLITDDNYQLFDELRLLASKDNVEPAVEIQEPVIEKIEGFVLTDAKYNDIPTSKGNRCDENVEAIKTLKIAEYEERPLTDEEKSIVSRFSGWGGISEAFDERNTSWSRQYENVKGILTDDEYADARASILNAYYTPPVITKTIYSALDELGFKGGKILEPSMGTGNFIGTMPDGMRANSAITGVELDSITGRIAKALYTDVVVNIKGFQDTNFRDNQFDVVIGNVPFGDYPIYDAAFKKRYLVHDYFFVKALDKVRPGGVIAFVTSSGTMDKLNDSIRSYIDERAEHIGSIRLNEDFFVGTKTTTDIIFLQKSERVLAKDSSFVDLSENADGVRMNKYFVDNPEMIIGKMINRIGRFGEESACISDKDMDIQDRLAKAVKNLSCTVIDNSIENTLDEKPAIEDELIPAPEDTPNYSYIFMNEKLYYNTDGMLEEINIKPTSVRYQRIKDVVDIRDTFKNLIQLEKTNAPDSQLDIARKKLNEVYDKFEENETKRVSSNKVKEVSLISNVVKRDFGLDASYPLVSSLNDRDGDGEIARAAIFYGRAISPTREIVSAETVQEALIYSLNERIRVDIPYMQYLTGKTAGEVITELKGEIYLNPQSADEDNPLQGYETRSEYLSGNVVDKLKIARIYAKSDSRFAENVAALETVQPEQLKSAEIDVKLGTTWIPIEYYREFMYEHLNTPIEKQDAISIVYDPFNSSYEITGKTLDAYSNEVTYLYGAGRICPAYRILEDSLNMRNTTVTRTIDGKVEVNMKTTTVARQKQELLNNTFKQWIFSNPEREEKLVKLYNDRFNNLVPREYDGSGMTFPNQSPNFNLRQHQRNAVARIMQSRSTLLAHEVGAGKTACMATAGHEMKRLNVANKILYVVPNHLVKQMATEIYKIYPAANLLVLDPEKDMSSQKKDISLAKIMTGRYDGIVMAHSSFDRIGISDELKKKMLSKQLSEIENVSSSLTGKSDTKTRIEKRRKSVTAMLEELNNRGTKSKVINYEDLNIDALVVDEFHAYKNAPIVTKLSRVAGVPGSPSGKAMSMMAKIDYMYSQPNKKVVGATGTPVTNSLAELYVDQRYFQPEILRERGLNSFDDWVSTFANVESSYELAVEGGEYRLKERLATFNNLPELITMFKNAADIQTQETLQLPRPELKTGKPIVVTVEPSEYVQDYIESLADRAVDIRQGNVKPTDDNFLKITTDGRKAAIDMRLIDSSIEDTGENKLDAVVDNTYNLWEEYTVDKAAQLIFCDQGVPGKDKDFDVYNDIKSKLVAKGIPEAEIQFIHDHETPVKKDELFFKVRRGDVRVLIGSTEKMGTGTNVQKQLVGMHNVDVPWRPDQETQRVGRMVRQGNMYNEVYLYRYVTEGSFDAYSWSIMRNKHKFISQIMVAKNITVRSMDNVDARALEYSEVMALASGNPLIRDKMQVESDIVKLEMLKQQDEILVGDLRRAVAKAPQMIELQEIKIEKIKQDMAQTLPDNKDSFSIVVNGREYTDKADGVEMLHQVLKTGVTSPQGIGVYRGFTIYAEPTGFLADHTKYTLEKNSVYEFSVGGNPNGTLTKINNKINGLENALEVQQKELERLKKTYKINKEKLAVGSTFKQQDKLDELKKRKEYIYKELKIKDKNANMPMEQPEQEMNDNRDVGIER